MGNVMSGVDSERVISIFSNYSYYSPVLLFLLFCYLTRRFTTYTKKTLKPPKQQQKKKEKTKNENIRKVKGGLQYFLDKEIGEGSDGTKVYEGELSVREVAVKCLDKDQKQNYDREVHILNIYERHPNLILKYDAKENNGNFLIILERCECNLKELISVNSYTKPTLVSQKVASLKSSIPLFKNGQKDHLSQDLLYLIRDIIRGLSHLHRYNIVHGDLTPQNILIDTSKKAKICDMGQAMILEDQNEDDNIPSSKGLVGTKGWRAPELISNGNITCAVDVFTLGLVLYFCVTEGDHPFGNGGIFEDDDDLENMINEAGSYPLNLTAVKNREIQHLLSKLLVHSHLGRPESASLTKYPIFWPSMKRLQFLHDYYSEAKLLGSPKTACQLQFIIDLDNTVQILDGRPRWYTRFGPQLQGQILGNHINRPDYTWNNGGTKAHQLIRFIRDFTEHLGDNPIYKGAVRNSTNFKVTENFFMSLFPTLVVQLYDFLRAEGWDQKPFLVGYYP